MARTVQPEQYAARENEILDAAQALMLTKGYAQMTIQDVLEALRISKGAFYHYYGSKQALLEALVARMVRQVMAVLQPVALDPTRPALAKLEAIFQTTGGWKYERRTLMVTLLRLWYANENVLLRDKVSRATLVEFGALLGPVIAQGIAEGVMRTDYPEQAGAIVMGLTQCMGLEMAPLLLTWQETPAVAARVLRLAAAYEQAVERVLGIAPGAVRLLDPALVTAWGEAMVDMGEAAAQDSALREVAGGAGHEPN